MDTYIDVKEEPAASVIYTSGSHLQVETQIRGAGGPDVGSREGFTENWIIIKK